MELNSEFLNKYNVSGPRYTSYPPANFFHANINSDNYIEELQASNTQKPENISLYIHIPFCPLRCHFCGCNTTSGQNRSVVRRYIDAVKKEIKIVANNLDLNRRVTQIHWGGGTPNSIAMSFIEEIMDLIKETFVIAKNAEIAIECSPAYLDFPHIDELAGMGFNRVSLGIQDFREDILEVVNRQAPKHPVKDIVEYFREKGFSGINLDFIYGLPMQTTESFRETLNKAIEIKPDRIVTFSYAHVPWVKEAQKKLEEVGLPQAKDKIAMLINSIKQLQDAGYISIGIDHFAKPEDDLAQAYLNKKLHRNFQGYCTLETTGQVYGFGASSISQLWGAYIQNRKGIFEYMDSVEKTGFAVERGYILNKNEQLVRSVVNSIMCNGILIFDKIASQFHISVDEVKSIIAFDKSRFLDFENDGLIQINNDSITVSDKGRMIARNIAMALDPALKQGEAIYSKTV
ncbi:Coproporphyrinogen III oxidase, oxygen-independent [hydrothermal vent metagenome]|uniref:coproporphyrinogen dehydrogenase n=1 Tax=hydrothermal vent metagenome TaxID=652676 RepID=A0A3B0VB44_9ZZZZ